MEDYEQLIRMYAGKDGSIPAEAAGALCQAVASAAEEGKAWKAKYEAERTALAEYRAAVRRRDEEATAERLLREELTAAGISGRQQDAVVRATDMRTIAVKDGELADAGSVREEIRRTWGALMPVRQTRGAVVDQPPARFSGMTREKFRALSLDGRIRLKQEDPDTYARMRKE